jgi:glycosyltransferase involved in cell wall biosynthesis
MVLFFLLWCFGAVAAEIQEKILICGIGRNVEKAIPNTIRSAENLGSRFADYRVIIYENNSTDRTKELFSEWEKKNPKVLFLSEKISKRRIAKQLSMKKINRTEVIARARNCVLDKAMAKRFDGYKYILWADLDFMEPWDVENLVDTILHPEQEWDGVFAYGAYDLFALRSPEWPIGFELLGLAFWENMIDTLRSQFVLSDTDPWKRVYSAFGGIAIYKREALKECRYSGVVTDDLEQSMAKWLESAGEETLFYKEYKELLPRAQTIDLGTKILKDREKYPSLLGVRRHPKGIVWFSCTPETNLPWTCEHVPFHASMSLRGADKLFINPKIRCHP